MLYDFLAFLLSAWYHLLVSFNSQMYNLIDLLQKSEYSSPETSGSHMTQKKTAYLIFSK